MKTLLIPSDFSKGSFKAVEYGFSLAKEFGSKIIICHAFELPAQGINLLIDISSELQKNAKDELENLENKIVKAGLSDGVEVEYLALLGDLNEVMNTIAEQKNADLVLMGTKGESDISSKMFGTNTVSAIKRCSIPLLVIPTGVKYKPIKNIAFAVDYLKPKKNNILETLRAIAIQFKSRVNLLNVRIDGDVNEFIDSTKEMKGWYSNQLKDVNQDYTFVEDNLIEDGLFEFIQNNPVDLLTVITKKHKFFDRLFHKSVSEELALHAEIPLLTLKD